MNFLVNCSNLKAGGGLQVADSVCRQLVRFPQHHFVVVLSDYLESTGERIENYQNVDIYNYTIPNTFQSIILGRDRALDDLVASKNIQAVLTIFGPSRWKPKVPHLSGFALPQLVIPESPYFQRMRFSNRLKWWLWCSIRKWSLKRSANLFWTENPYISRRLESLFEYKKRVLTVSNYYNQVFDQPEMWVRSIKFPVFEGITCLSVSTNSSHKNFGIATEIIRHIQTFFPDFKLRFVFTFNREELEVPKDMEDNFLFTSKVDVSEVPYLYEQADIMFMPTLLECFTATYPEAMRMEVPIVTTDLEFARELCGDAACYYSAVDAKAAAEAIYKVATDKTYAQQLVDNGKKQLLKYDNYKQRTEKLVKILEEISID